MARFDDIIDGKGEYREIRADGVPLYAIKAIADPIRCADGTTISVQGSSMHYCTPRRDHGPYTHVEIGYPDVDPPPAWAAYADGEYPSDVYGYVPVELVREYIEAHGGEAPPADTGEDAE